MSYVEHRSEEVPLKCLLGSRTTRNDAIKLLTETSTRCVKMADESTCRSMPVAAALLTPEVSRLSLSVKGKNVRKLFCCTHRRWHRSTIGTCSRRFPKPGVFSLYNLFHSTSSSNHFLVGKQGRTFYLWSDRMLVICAEKRVPEELLADGFVVAGLVDQGLSQRVPRIKQMLPFNGCCFLWFADTRFHFNLW